MSTLTIDQKIQREETRLRGNLGNFSPTVQDDHRKNTTKSYKYSIDKIPYDECRLIAYILEHLLGCKTEWLPMEKIHWWSDFSYKGVFCSIAHQKFGFKIYVSDANGLSEEEANSLSEELINELKSIIKELGVVISLYAKQAIKVGKIILNNKMADLENRYSYYRDESFIDPDVKFDLSRDFFSDDSSIEELRITDKDTQETRTKKVNEALRRQSEYMRALESQERNQEVAVIYFISLMEHMCLLLYAFYNDGGSVVDLAMKSWGDKFESVIGTDDDDIKQGFEYLKKVALYKRNPVAHGFLTPKMTEASFYFEPARQRTAINLLNGELADESGYSVDLSKLDKLLADIRKSPKFHNAMEYLSNSEFDISYDARSLKKFKILNSLDDEDLEEYIKATGREYDNATNMDW